MPCVLQLETDGTLALCNLGIRHRIVGGPDRNFKFGAALILPQVAPGTVDTPAKAGCRPGWSQWQEHCGNTGMHLGRRIGMHRCWHRVAATADEEKQQRHWIRITLVELSCP